MQNSIFIGLSDFDEEYATKALGRDVSQNCELMASRGVQDIARLQQE